ncbi:MAG: hypothetical protein K2N58_01210 [Treponemataceae bacterium]|nr:hypothetical protein [Treponemataceae bacterium]
MKTRIETNAILMAIIIALCALIFISSIVAFIAGKRPGMNLRRNDPKGVEQIKGASDALNEFKEFGTLRITTMPNEDSQENSSVLVVTPWLSYEGNDSAFYEELVSRKRLFTSFFVEYFSSRSKNALLSIGEKNIKQELLDKFNLELRLGQLSAIYFDDYIFLD